jgi:citrate synthase
VSDDRDRIAEYWRTAICDIKPGAIAFRGYAIQELIGAVGFPAMIWLLLRGELPTQAQLRLLEAAMVASVDHGPHAPSIAVAQMAVSSGLPLNGAIASAVNLLDDVHGGAGEQAVGLFEAVSKCALETGDLERAAEDIVDKWVQTRGKNVPGFGHRFHPVDPRVAPLLRLVAEAKTADVVSGHFAAAAQAVDTVVNRGRSRSIPMNIDGVTAIIYGELGFAAPLARGLFCLSRSVGIVAHAWEQSGRPDRIKGPIPRNFDFKYTGPAARPVPAINQR